MGKGGITFGGESQTMIFKTVTTRQMRNSLILLSLGDLSIFVLAYGQTHQIIGKLF